MPRAQNDKITSQFFHQLFSVVVRFGGENLLERFHAIREEREKYLREQWDNETGNIGPAVFRDIDFEHLLTLLHRSVASEDNGESRYKVFLSIIKICVKFGEFGKARAMLKSLQNSDLEPFKIGQLNMLYGKLALLSTEYEDSIHWYQTAADIFEEIGDLRGLAAANNNLGIVAYEQWQTHHGKKYFDRARSLFESFKDESLKISIQVNTAIVEAMRGESSEATRIFADILEKVGFDNMPYRTSLLINYGMAARDDGDFVRAKQILKEALANGEKLQDQRLLGLAHLALAEVLARMGNGETGFDHLIIAFRIFSNLHDTVSLADVYRVFGILHMEQGYYELAENELQICLRVNKEKGNILNLSETFYSLSRLARKQGKGTLRREYLKKTLALCETMKAVRRVQTIKGELASLVNK